MLADMALVDYASSSGEDEVDVTATATAIPSKEYHKTVSLKRKREGDTVGTRDLPPLPSRFHDLYASTTRVGTSDNPDLHGGRKRATPHIEGNWPTHIYIEWHPSATEYHSLEKMILTVKEASKGAETSRIHSFLTSDLGVPLPLHVSLSRPIGFSTEQKESFVASLEQAVKSHGTQPFDITFSGLDWVANFENTRWFLVIRLRKPLDDNLNKLLHISNTVVGEHGQPPLYTKASSLIYHEHTPRSLGAANKHYDKRSSSGAAAPKAKWSNMEDATNAFHISIAWTLKAPSQELLDFTASAASDYLKDMSQIRIKTSEIKAKVGNTVTNLPLRSKTADSKRLFGV